MIWPQRAIFWPFPGRGLEDKPSNVNFGMEHPWAQLLRFRKDQFEGPCFGHERATFEQFLAKGTTGFTHQCEIWH